MIQNKPRLIHCKGRYITGKGKVPCQDDFTHIGKWGDHELVQHEHKERANDTKYDWHLGFDDDKKFVKFQESYAQAQTDKQVDSEIG